MPEQTLPLHKLMDRLDLLEQLGKEFVADVQVAKRQMAQQFGVSTQKKSA